MKNIKLISFILFFIFIFTQNINKLTPEQNKEIEHLFKEIILKAQNQINNINSISSKDKTCNLCKNIVKTNRESIIEKYGFEGVLKIAKLFCSLALDQDVCEGAIQEYGPFTLNVLAQHVVDEEKICAAINLCDDVQYEDVDAWAKELLKDKPSKKKEDINLQGDKIKMIQMTDVHYDLKYKEGSSVECTKPLCCREPAEPGSKIVAGKFGYAGHCDINENLFKSYVDAAYNLKPDFIVWTGDNAPHDVWEGSQDNVYESTKKLKNMLNEKFNHSVPIYPILGNHEKYPNDAYSTSGEPELLKNMADLYKEYLDDQAYESFKKFGYYSMKHKDTNLRIIGLNCLICDTFNFYLIANQKDAKEEFKWLEKTLREAEKNNEFVYILDHIPINGNFYLTECALRMRALIDRFEYNIRGYFTGHTHVDDVVVVKTYFEPRRPITLNYVAPALTTYPYVYPSFRQYIIDPKTMLIIDYEQYRLNTEEANKSGNPVWKLSHTAKELFNVNHLEEVNKIYNYTVGEKYIQKRVADHSRYKKYLSKESYIKECQCTITEDSYGDWMNCAHPKLDISGAQLFSFLNKLGGKWKKEEDL